MAAHVRLVGADGRSVPDHRYLMVTAVRADQQRTGLAQRLVESVLVDQPKRIARPRVSVAVESCGLSQSRVFAGMCSYEERRLMGSEVSMTPVVEPGSVEGDGGRRRVAGG